MPFQTKTEDSCMDLLLSEKAQRRGGRDWVSSVYAFPFGIDLSWRGLSPHQTLVEGSKGIGNVFLPHFLHGDMVHLRLWPIVLWKKLELLLLLLSLRHLTLVRLINKKKKSPISSQMHSNKSSCYPISWSKEFRCLQPVKKFPPIDLKKLSEGKAVLDS